MGKIQDDVSRLAIQNERFVDVMKNGTREEKEAFIKEMIEDSKGVEAENTRRLKRILSRFDTEVEKAKSEGRLLDFLSSQYRNIACASFDDYLILSSELRTGVDRFFKGADMMKRLNDVAEENGIDNITFQRAQTDINYLGIKLIKRMREKKSDMSKEEKEKTISEIKPYLKLRSFDQGEIVDLLNEEKK